MNESSPLTVSVEEAARRLGVSRSLAFQEVRKGSLAGVKPIRCGRRYLIPLRALERLLDGELADRADGRNGDGEPASDTYPGPPGPG